MNKVILYIAMSLDGYIADINGSVEWISGDGTNSDNYGTYETFIKTVDTIIMGEVTYNQIVNELSVDVWPYEDAKTYVLTDNDYQDSKAVTFTNQNINTLIAKLKEGSSKNIWICGGAYTVNSLIEADLIDQYVITIIPTLLGNGIKLFTEHQKELPLKLISTTTYNGITDLVYERRI